MEYAHLNIEKILAHFKFDSLNKIQEAALNANALERDFVLLANTGSGKTLAYLLPILQLLKRELLETQALIIVPSRELALQIEQVFRTMQTGYKITCCYGGHMRATEENNLIEPPALIVGTAGRLADHIRRKNITTQTISTIVLDEFDKSLELGFLDEIEFIIKSLPCISKRILISATQKDQIPNFIGIKNEVILNFLTPQTIDESKLSIKIIYAPQKDKIETLINLICYLGNKSCVIFCNHREAVERTSETLKAKGIFNIFYHGAMEQRDRDIALCKFRNGTSDILVTTDLASRGLDIPNIRYIIHYQLPATEDIYTHRNGRTARVDASGTIILILISEEKLPDYIGNTNETIQLSKSHILPEKPKWTTLYISAGKKDKINKIDIVGFFIKIAQLKRDEIGLIEVKDFNSFVAIKKSKVLQAIELIKGHKMKHKTIKIEVAK